MSPNSNKASSSSDLMMMMTTTTTTSTTLSLSQSLDQDETSSIPILQLSVKVTPSPPIISNLDFQHRDKQESPRASPQQQRRSPVGQSSSSTSSPSSPLSNPIIMDGTGQHVPATHSNPDQHTPPVSSSSSSSNQQQHQLSEQQHQQLPQQQQQSLHRRPQYRRSLSRRQNSLRSRQLSRHNKRDALDPTQPQYGATVHSTAETTAACSYTERTYHSDSCDDYNNNNDDDDEFCEEERLNDVTGEDDEGEDDGDDDGSDACCDSDDDGGDYHQRYPQGQNPYLRRTSSNMSVSAQTLSSAFSLNDLGSIETVSSLGGDDVYDELGSSCHGCDDEGELHLDGCAVTKEDDDGHVASATRNQPCSPSSDVVDDDISMDSATHRIRRQNHERVDIHEIREVFCHPLKRQISLLKVMGEDSTRKEKRKEGIEGVPFSPENDADDGDENYDDDNAALQRTILRMHESMAITTATAQRSGRGKNISKFRLDDADDNVEEEEFFVLEEEEEEDDSINAQQRQRKLSFDESNADGDSSMPMNLAAEKDFLSRLAIPNNGQKTSTVGKATMTVQDLAPQSPIQNRVCTIHPFIARRRIHSRDSSEYTEVLVSSDDSLGLGGDDVDVDVDGVCWITSEGGRSPSRVARYTPSPTRRQGQGRMEEAICGKSPSFADDDGILEGVLDEEEEYHEEIIEEEEEEVIEEVIEDEVDTRYGIETGNGR